MSQIQVFIWEKDVVWGCVVDREIAERVVAAL